MSFTDKCIEALSRAELSFCEEGLISSLDNFPLFISYNKSGSLEMFRVVYNGEIFYIFKEWLFDAKFSKLKKEYLKKAKSLHSEYFS